MPTPIVVQISAAASFGATDTAAPTLSGVTSGNDLICIVMHQDYGNSSATFTVVDSVGSTAYNNDIYVTGASGEVQVEIASNYAVAAGSHTATVTASGNATQSFGAAVLIEVSGLQANGLDKTASNSGNSSTPTTGTTSALAGTGELAIVAVSMGASMAGGTFPPAGYTALVSSPAGTFSDCDYQLSASSSGMSAAWGTTTNPNQWAGAIAVYKAALAAPYSSSMGLCGVGI
jgi:hypothetical protein